MVRILDWVGCVWQLTTDVYENGSYRYIIMRGGSYFKPSSGWWYMQGGPRELFTHLNPTVALSWERFLRMI